MWLADPSLRRVNKRTLLTAAWDDIRGDRITRGKRFGVSLPTARLFTRVTGG